MRIDLPLPYFAKRNATVDIIGPWWIKDGKIVSCEFVRASRWASRTYDFKQAQNVNYDALIVVVSNSEFVFGINQTCRVVSGLPL